MRKKPRRTSLKLTIAVCIISFFALYSYISRTPAPIQKSPKDSPKAPKAPVAKEYSSVFVPSWQLPDASLLLTDPTNPDRSIDQDIYFAISPDSTGNIIHDTAYLNLSRFSQLSTKPSLLTLKMTDENTNTLVLRSKQAQELLIGETITLARRHNFSGIVLDLEHSVLPFKEVRTSITSFSQRFSTASHEQKLTFDMTLYGDAYYRARPYDVADLEPHVDMFYIMAYDFHKAFGEPGPNFPLTCGSTTSPTYAYCLTRLLDDFLKDVPADKITLVYGLYGYTWDVDSQNRPASSATARTYAQLKNISLDCPNSPCAHSIDSVSSESTRSYSKNGRKFITWYETPTSVQKKSTYALSRGVSRIAFWAFGYY